MASLVDDTSNAFAFAPLRDPDRITVEGSVSSYPAWSTSKVLVVAAFLTPSWTRTQPTPARRVELISRVLRESDAGPPPLLDEIPDPTEAMTWVLRNIGTPAPRWPRTT